MAAPRIRPVSSFLLTFATATWFGTGLALWLGQERMIFPAPAGFPREEQDRAAARLGATPLDLVAEDGTPLYGRHLASPAGKRRLVLLFHGNADVVMAQEPLFRLLAGVGWDAMVIAYRGYPGSGGSPSEQGLLQDARAAWAWATGPGGYDPERIVVHGSSLGGAVAAGLVAGEATPKALVLEQTFATMRDLARRRAPVYPVDLLLRHPFDTRDRVAALDLPALVLHSTDDALIPPDLGGRQLAKVLPRGEYHEVSGWGHGPSLPLVDPRVREVYLAFLERQVP